MKTLFVKHAGTRNPRYCVRTSIVADAQGARSVRKEAMYPEAKAHLDAIVAGTALLSAWAAAFDVAPCQWDGDAIVSPFIEGVLLHTQFGALLDADDDAGVYARLDRYRDTLASIGLEERTHIADGQFQTLFGSNGVLAEGAPVRCIPIAPLDFVPGNIVEMPDGRWVGIDAEWVYDFPVPLNFVLFRGIKSLETARHAGRGLQMEQMFYHLGIGPDEALRYEAWDRALSAHIVEPDGLLSVSTRYERAITRVDATPPACDGYAPIAFSRVYVDRGAGFCETDSMAFATRSGSPFRWEWDPPVGETIHRLRLDPCEGKFAYLSVHRAVWHDDGGVAHDFDQWHHNGWPWEEGVVFASLDPWLSFACQTPSAMRHIQIEGAWRFIAPEEVEEMLVLSRLAHWQTEQSAHDVGPAFRALLSWQKAIWTERIAQAESETQKNRSLASAAREQKQQSETLQRNRETHWRAQEAEWKRRHAAMERIAREWEQTQKTCQTQRNNLQSQCNLLQNELAQSRAETDAMRNELAALQGRLSWRVMEPCRRLFASLRGDSHADKHAR